MPSKIEKLCVFCGEKPEKKTKEHVIPKWLMKLTGGEHRQAFLGVRYSDGPENIGIHRHAMSAYTVPACDTCNGKFARLEELTKPIVEKLLGERPVSATEVGNTARLVGQGSHWTMAGGTNDWHQHLPRS